jgi:protein-S-isoprenylcysteine O-methyltransferase Ste14
MSAFDRLFVWLGGAMFVVSLVACTGWYLFVLGHIVPTNYAGQPDLSSFNPLVAFAEDTVLITVFALHHSLLARDSVKRTLPIPAHLVRSVYVWTASVLLLVVCLFWQPIGLELYRAVGARAFVHALVQLTGVVLVAAAVARIDPLDLAGIRQPGAPEPLQIAGPYHLVRHPVYLGWMIAVFGAAHMTGDRLAFAALTSFYLVLAVPWEERSLRQSFGNSYDTYARRVRWRIIPLVY